MGKRKWLPQPPAPTLDDAYSRLGNRGDSIDTRRKKIVEELLKLQKHVAHPSNGSRFKQRAMQLMQQKRQNERQRDQVYQQQFNIDQLAFTKEMIQDTKVQVEAMRSIKNFLTFLIGLMYKKLGKTL